MTIHRDTQLNDEQQLVYVNYRTVDFGLEQFLGAFDRGSDIAAIVERLQITNAKNCAEELFAIGKDEFTADELHEFVANAFAEWSEHNV